MDSYDPGFYNHIQDGSVSSSEVVLSLLWETFTPTSVVDIGCGQGAWLRTAKQLGTTRVLGVDGEYVHTAGLLVSPDEFIAHDLSTELPSIGRFDMALCLEVAEHLPEERAESFIADLCRLSDVIVFSAAVPGQGGVNHINERWPSWWIPHFIRRGFDCVDLLRPRIWADDRVEVWYRQNVFVAARPELLVEKGITTRHTIWDIAHPGKFEELARRLGAI